MNWQCSRCGPNKCPCPEACGIPAAEPAERTPLLDKVLVIALAAVLAAFCLSDVIWQVLNLPY